MTLLSAIAVGLVAIWGLVLACRGSLLVGSAAYLVVASVFGYEFWHFDLLGVSLSLDRLLLLMLCGAAVLQSRLRSDMNGLPVGSEWWLIGFIGVLLANMFSHNWRRSGPIQIPILQHCIEGYLIPCLLFWMARARTVREGEVQWVYGVWGVFGCYLAGTALMEYFQVWSLVFPKYIADPTLGIHFGRARGPFLQSVRLGMFLMAGLASLWVPLVWQQRYRQVGLVVGLGGSILMVLGMAVTLTRSVWLGLAVAIFLVVLLTFHQPFRRVGLYGLIVAALLIVPLKNQLLMIKRESSSAETLESSRMRAVFAYVSWLMFQERPLTGFGFGHFPHEKRQFLNDRETTLHLESIRDYIHHNGYLSILVELGLVGLVLYLAVLVAWWRQAWWLWHLAGAPEWVRGQALVGLTVLASYVVQMAFHELSYTPFENGILFLAAGTVSGLCRTVCCGGTRKTVGGYPADRRSGAVMFAGQ